jgi:hypothetical protein
VSILRTRRSTFATSYQTSTLRSAFSREARHANKRDGKSAHLYLSVAHGRSRGAVYFRFMYEPGQRHIPYYLIAAPLPLYALLYWAPVLRIPAQPRECSNDSFLTLRSDNREFTPVRQKSALVVPRTGVLSHMWFRHFGV